MSLKQEFLRLLREDEEFRLAVAGLLGLDSILRELKQLREDFQNYVRLWQETWRKFLEDHERRWEENNKRWEENNRRWEENERRWKENEKRWEENNKRWEENNRRWEENERRWKEWFETWRKFLEENDRRWEESERRWRDLVERVNRVELGLGALTEATYCRFVWEDLKAELSARGELVVERERGAVLDGVEVDLLVVTDRAAYVVEVKTKPGVEDVGALLAKAEVASAKLGKPVVPILAGAYIGGEVKAYARGKGIRVYSY